MRIILLAYLSFIGHILYGQIDENQIIQLGDSVNTAFNSIEQYRDTLYISGTVYNTETYDWDLALIKADTFFNIVDTTFVETPPETFGFNMIQGDGLKTLNNNFLFVGPMDHGQKWAFIKTNSQLNIESLQIYQDTTVSVYRVRAVTQLGGYYYATGYIAPYTSPPNEHGWGEYIVHGFMMKLDTLGNTVWQREYEMGMDTSIFIVENQVSHDGNILMGGFISNLHHPQQPYWSAPYLVKIDPETGDIVYSYQFEDERIVYSSTTYALDDGSILSGGYRVNYAHPDYNLWFLDLMLQRIDSSGNLMWEQKIGPLMKSFDSQTVYEILPMPDGRFAYVACNELGLNYNSNNQSRVAVTAVFDANTGDIDWTRVDSIPYPGVDNERNHVQGATILSSGSIVISGYQNETGNVHGWLLKIDKNGCVGDDCSHYLPVATDEVVNEAIELPLIIPNPTSGTFRLSRDIDSDLYIYDLQGRFVHKIDRQQTKGEMDIGFLDAGMYFVWGAIEGKEFVVKLVKM